MQSIGERLEEARKRKGLSIREASEATKIRSDYLHKFESNQFDINLPDIYVRGFLRTYANFLKASPDKIMNDFNGLGLGDAKSNRHLNREVYGRMDLSVGSKVEKPTKENQGPAAATAEPAIATNADAAPRNPATFVPPAAPRTQIDRDLIFKGGVLVVGLAIVVLLGVWLFSSRGSKQTTTTVAGNASTDAVWVKPLAGEPVLSLKAIGPVSVTVTTKNDRTTLYQGTIPRGDRRDIPRRGALYVTADPYQNLTFEISGSTYNMPGGAADIRAP
jgi:transcriptional regulator with XRE-family HTH domain